MPGASPYGFSSFPIRYANGEIRLVQKDIEGTGYGTNWSHTRTYQSRHYLNSSGTPCDPIDSDCSPTIYDGPNGANWYSSDWPYLVSPGPNVINVRGDANNTLWFDRQLDGSYVARFGQPQTLVLDTVNHMYVLTGLDGGVTRFNDSVQTTYPQGLFSSFTDPAGNVTRVTAYGTNTTIGEIAEIQRTVTIDGVTSTQTFSYSYDWSGRLDLVLLQSTTGATTTNVAKAAYTYVGNVYEFANLRTVERFNWTNGGWESLGTTYYRYSNSLFLAPLQFVVGPQGYADLLADGLNPDTAADSELLNYADHYFNYDTQGRVITETVDRGTLTYRYTYARSSFPHDYNNWKFKTTESLPDGNINIIYTNYAGMVMLKVYLASSSGSSSSSSSSSGHSPSAWYEFYRYNSNAVASLTASSAAVLGYDESIATLLNYNSLTDTYQYLNNSAGALSKFTYHSPTNWIATETVQEGQLGTPVPIRSKSYISCCNGGSSSSSGSGITTCRYLPSQDTVYSDDAGAHPITKSYAYTYHSGTCAVKQITTTLPVVSVSQNGSGTPDTRKDCFDTYGNKTWMMDERGFITRLIYDIPTGTVVQRIDDVNMSLVTGGPAGWTTPAGGGLHLITDYSIDIQGRTTRSLGPSHTIDLNGTATSVRATTWTIYQDGDFQTWTGEGYATGSSPSYSFTLINPVQITITNATGNVTEQISATRGSGLTSSGALISSDTFAQSSYVRWTTTQYLACCFIASQRIYKLIPTTGVGLSGTNFDESGRGYDTMKRLNRQVTPGGTITRTAYERRGLPVATWIGTNDTGATDNDPSGGGAFGNNMVQVTGLEYDSGLTGGNGRVTRQTEYVDNNPTNNRVTTYTYDFRGRRTAVDGEIDFYQKNTYDNLNRVIQLDRSNTTAGGTLISRRAAKYDDRGRVYQRTVYGVDPTTGTVGNSLIDNLWYDANGNLIKSFPAGSQSFTKTSYDSLGREVAQYLAFGADSSYADALTVTNNTVIEQTEMKYDDASNVVQTTTRLRYHDAPATQVGALQDPSTTPKARVSYTAVYPDALQRTQAIAEFGTNGGANLSRPSTIPSRSDSVLVSSTGYDPGGMPVTATSPAGVVTRTLYDAAGRSTSVTQNYITTSSSSSSGGSLCATSDDTNVTTQITYTADGLQATLVALNSRTGNQTTTYTYGTTLSDSSVATSMLLRYVAYPDSTGGSDRVAYSYNRQRQRTSLTDQRGCVHQYSYDLLGRIIHDRVTTLGSGVEGTVLRLSTAYEVRGLIAGLTSYDNATIGTGSIVNDVTLTYNSFGQTISDAQSHSGAVVAGTPKVQYSYSDGSTNMIRPTTLIYPNGREITIDYGTAGSTNDSLSRVSGLVDDDTTTLVNYTYLGSRTPVQTTYPQPSTQHTLLGSTSGNNPTTGDIYWGLDTFGRVIDSRWYNTTTSSDVDRTKYGYDRAGNRLWRQNTVATAAGKAFDEYYHNDALNRLKDMQRGTLNGTKTGITSPTFGQCWTLDPTGNWQGFNEASGGGTWTTIQSRTSNTANEITSISNSAGNAWAQPTYDPAGNMTTIPAVDGFSWPTLSTEDWTNLTIDEWATLDATPNMTATYDAWNRVATLINTTTSDAIAEYLYDARNRRTLKRLYSSGILDHTRHVYLSEHDQVLEERVDASADASLQNIWSILYIDGLVLRDRDTATSGTFDERIYCLQDINWNAVALADDSGAVIQRVCYHSYGSCEFLTALQEPSSNITSWATLFTGRELDHESELYYFRARSFESMTGRFLSRDTEGYADGAHLYAAYFVPSRLDPNGTWAWDGDWVQYGVGGMFGFYGLDPVKAAGHGAAQGGMAAIDGAIPIFDPFASSGMYDKCDKTLQWSQFFGGVSRDALLLAFLPSSGSWGQWIKNPAMYEIGSTTVPNAIWSQIGHLDVIARGRYLWSNYGWGSLLMPKGNWGATVAQWSGLTPAATLFSVAFPHGLDFLFDPCKCPK